MKELKCVKFNVGMYDDIKLKIIDTMKERDLIHYCLARFIVLAGKTNKDGYLYITKNMPYTIETLSIEFNRTIEEIELSVNVLIDLEILELTEGKIYKVKNWTKHQNIKKKCNENGYENKDSTEVLMNQSIDENKSSDKRSKEMSEHISEEEKKELIKNMDNRYEDVFKESIGKNSDCNNNLLEINLLEDENSISKDNSNNSTNRIIFEIEKEQNDFKINNEQDLIISPKMINEDLCQKVDKVEIKKKGRRGRPKKSSNNSKIKKTKKDNSLIQFSYDEYEDDDFNAKDNEFITFTMG